MEEYDSLLLEWFTKRNLSKNTRKGYSASMNIYLNFLNSDGGNYTVEKLLKEAEDDERSGELLRYRKINKHIVSFINHLENIGNSPGTINNRIAAISSFYDTMDIKTPFIQKKKGNTVLEKNQGTILTREEILDLINVASLRDQAIIYTMCLTGLAQNEITKLTLKKISESITNIIKRPIKNLQELFDSEREIQNSILTINLKREKANHLHFTFIPPEAHKRIFAYLKTRLESRNPKIHPKINGPLFVNRYGDSLTTSGMIKIFTKLGDTLDLPHEEGAFRNHRSHGLRKYFISTISNSTGDNALADYLAGHVPDTVSRAYKRPNEKNYLERYQNAYPFISIDEIKMKDIKSEEYVKITHEIEGIKAENEAIKKENEIIKRNYDALFQDIDFMEDVIELKKDKEN